jgi:hypothetical protein
MANYDLGQMVFKITGDNSDLIKSHNTSKKSTEELTKSLLSGSKSMSESFSRIGQSALALGDKTGGLSQKNELLKQKINTLIANGVNPASPKLKTLSDLYHRNAEELEKMRNKTDGAKDSTSSFKNILLDGVKIIAGFFAVEKIIDFSKELVRAGMSADTTEKKFKTLFGDTSTEAARMAEEIATAYRTNDDDVERMMTKTAFIAQGFGDSANAAMKTAGAIASLSHDIASFTGQEKSADEAAQALNAAYMGNVRGLREFGIQITEADLDKAALAQGRYYASLSDSEKAQIRLNVIMQKAAPVMGDYARNLNSLPNVMKAIDARSEEMNEQAGRRLTPALSSLGSAFLITSQKGGAFARILDSVASIASKAIYYVSKFILVNERGTSANMVNELVKERSRLSEMNTAYAKSIEALGGFDVARQKAASGSANEQREAKKALEGYTASGSALIKNNVELQTTAKRYDEASKAVVENEKAYTSQMAALEKNEENVKKLSDAEKKAAKEKPTIDKQQGGKNPAEIAKAQSDLEIMIAQNTGDQLSQIEADAAAKKMSIDEMVKNNLLNNQSELIAKAKKSIDDMAFSQKFQYIAGQVNSTVQTITSGITGVMQALITLNDAQLQSTLDSLDAEMKAQLEAAGVAEDTAVQTAQAEYDAAVAGGDATTIADKQRLLTKAKIEEEYNKKKAQAEYDAAVRGWELQKQMAMIQMLAAPLNAFVSSLTAPWPLNMILAPINAGLALATATLQYAAVAQAKPQPSKFANGGIVPGTSFNGDKVPVQANSGEMILTSEQQGQLFDIASGKGVNGNQIFRVAPIDKQVFYDDLYRASQDGRLYIAERAVQ